MPNWNPQDRVNDIVQIGAEASNSIARKLDAFFVYLGIPLFSSNSLQNCFGPMPQLFGPFLREKNGKELALPQT